MISVWSVVSSVLLAALIVLLGIYGFKPEWMLRAEFARQAWLAGVERKTISVGDTEWVYFERGVGPPLVLVHGFTGSKENWLPMVRYWGARHRLIIPDLPGWGESSRSQSGDYGIAAQSERLGQFLAALDLQAIDLVGHSMGGAIVGVMTARDPQRVETLSLVSTAGVGFTINPFAERLLAGELPFNVDDRAQWARLMDDLFVNKPFLPARLADVLIARNVRDHAFHRRVMDALRGPERRVLEELLPQIVVPTLVLWCEQDRILDISSTDVLTRQLKLAELAVLRGCGHMPMIERPQAMADVLGAFTVSHRLALAASPPTQPAPLSVDVIVPDPDPGNAPDPQR